MKATVELTLKYRIQADTEAGLKYIIKKLEDVEFLHGGGGVGSEGFYKVDPHKKGKVKILRKK